MNLGRGPAADKNTGTGREMGKREKGATSNKGKNALMKGREKGGGMQARKKRNARRDTRGANTGWCCKRKKREKKKPRLRGGGKKLNTGAKLMSGRTKK